MAGGRPRHPDLLTPAEWRVLEHLRAGRTNADIAIELGLSINTVKYHVANILAKLDLHSREELAAWKPAPAHRARFSRRAWAFVLGGGAAMLSLALVAFAFWPSTAAPSPPLPSEPLYFSSINDPGIRKVTAEGKESMVFGKFHALAPSVSPDGSAIAYLQLLDTTAPIAPDSGAVADLVTLDLGDGFVRFLDPQASVEPLAGVVARPAWTPDGQYVLFHTQDHLLSTIRANGEERQDRLLGCPTVSWPPSGALGTCAVPHPENVDVYFGPNFRPSVLIRPAGPAEASPSRHIALRGTNVGPAISPDERWISWWHQPEGSPTVWVAPLDEAAQAFQGEDVATDLGPGREPSWSPSANTLLFSSGASTDLYRFLGLDPAVLPRGDIFVYNPDTKRLTNLTNGHGNNISPAWSPDGNWIAFISDRDDPHGEVYVMRADGSDLRRLTHNDFAETFLVWSPR